MSHNASTPSETTHETQFPEFIQCIAAGLDARSSALLSPYESLMFVPVHTLASYLSSRDIISLAQTCQGLRDLWLPESFTLCTVYKSIVDDPNRQTSSFSLAKNTQMNKRGIPYKAFLNPNKYSFFLADAVKRIDFGDAMICYDEYKEVVRFNVLDHYHNIVKFGFCAKPEFFKLCVFENDGAPEFRHTKPVLSFAGILDKLSIDLLIVGKPNAILPIPIQNNITKVKLVGVMEASSVYLLTLCKSVEEIEIIQSSINTNGVIQSYALEGMFPKLKKLVCHYDLSKIPTLPLPPNEYNASQSILKMLNLSQPSLVPPNELFKLQDFSLVFHEKSTRYDFEAPMSALFTSYSESGLVPSEPLDNLFFARSYTTLEINLPYITSIRLIGPAFREFPVPTTLEINSFEALSSLSIDLIAFASSDHMTPIVESLEYFSLSVSRFSPVGTRYALCALAKFKFTKLKKLVLRASTREESTCAYIEKNPLDGTGYTAGQKLVYQFFHSYFQNFVKNNNEPDIQDQANLYFKWAFSKLENGDEIHALFRRLFSSETNASSMMWPMITTEQAILQEKLFNADLAEDDLTYLHCFLLLFLLLQSPVTYRNLLLQLFMRNIDPTHEDYPVLQTLSHHITWGFLFDLARDQAHMPVLEFVHINECPDTVLLTPNFHYLVSGGKSCGLGQDGMTDGFDVSKTSPKLKQAKVEIRFDPQLLFDGDYSDYYCSLEHDNGNRSKKAFRKFGIQDWLNKDSSGRKGVDGEKEVNKEQSNDVCFCNFPPFIHQLEYPDQIQLFHQVWSRKLPYWNTLLNTSHLKFGLKRADPSIGKKSRVHAWKEFRYNYEQQPDNSQSSLSEGSNETAKDESNENNKKDSTSQQQQQQQNNHHHCALDLTGLTMIFDVDALRNNLKGANTHKDAWFRGQLESSVDCVSWEQWMEREDVMISNEFDGWL